MARISILSTAAVVVLLTSVAPAFAEHLIRAAIADGQVYVSPLANVRAGEPSWEEAGGHFTLMGQGLPPSSTRVTLKHPDVVEGRPTANILHRWQVEGKRVHFLSYDPSEGTGVEPYFRAMLLVSSPLELVASLKTPIPSTPEGDDRRKEFDPTRKREDPPGWRKSIARRVTESNREFVFFDFLPAAADGYEWYVSEPDGKRNRITRWDSQPPLKKGDRAEWKEVGVWNADFGSRFFAVSSDNDRYFINDEGHIYFAPRPAKAGTSLKELWKDKPVVALIHDADNAKWFAFTKDQYFEVSDPIKPLAHTLAISRAKTANEALEVAAKCARVIRGLPEPKAK